jgi:citrate lyase beta subunit
LESETLTYARADSSVVSVGALHAPHDGAYLRHGDHEGLRLEAEHARRLGFGGKHAIHPDQVPHIARVFGRPSMSDWTGRGGWSRRSTGLRRPGQAAITVDGKLVDYPVAARARQLLATYEAAS